MRQTVYSMSMTMALALMTSACGRLDNAPFRTGNVRGRLTEADPAVALVSLVGHPDVRGTVTGDGSFVLEQVPAGPVELFILASTSKAVRLPVVVPGGGTARVADVVPRVAGYLELRVKAPARLGVGRGLVAVTGTPLQKLQLGEDGRLQVGPLPEGCYALETAVPGFPVQATDTCVGEGEHKELKIQLPAPDEDYLNRGCAFTGCESGSQCASHGRCVECASDAQCAPGLSCRNERCEGPGVLCASCDGDWKCRSGARCEELPEGEMACVAKCTGNNGCAQGFTCQNGRCLPPPTQLASCFAYRQVGSHCHSNEHCREQGLVQGLCIENTCTFRCTSDAECPEGFICSPSFASTVCQPRR